MGDSVLFFLVFAASSLIFLSFYKDSKQKKQEVERRLFKAVSQRSERIDYQLDDKSEDKSKSILQKVLRSLSRLFAERQSSKKIEQQLAMADIPLRGEEFIVIVFVLALLSFFAAFILLDSMIAALLFLFLGAVLPFLYVKRAMAVRLRKFDSQITDAITILANSLRSGYSFLQSLDMVRRELPPPLKTELARTIREINLGGQMEEALVNLSKRSNSQDMDIMVTAVLIQRQVGGNLAEILDKINETINERLRIKGEVRTLTAQGRISGTIIGLLPFALAIILFLINPDYMMTLFKSVSGLCMVGVALLMELIGLIMIKKIINIEI